MLGVLLGGKDRTANLSLKNVIRKYLNGSVVVKGFNFKITDKELTIFVGPSGCDKSTTLRMIAGLGDISSGEPYIDDKLVNDVELKDRDIAMVFQNYALYPHMSVYDNMAFRLKLRETSKDGIDKKVHDVAKILNLGHLLDRKPKALSGGQRQRVAMGRATVRSPKVFLMDEPLSSLNAELRGQMRVEISKLHQGLETTIIYTTHGQAEVMTPGIRIIVMEDDIIRQVDNPQNLYDRPCNKFVAGFIGVSQVDMIDATVSKDGALTTLSFDERTVALSEAKSKKLEDAGHTGKVVTLDIRPEDPHGEESYPAIPPKSILEVTVRVYEILGSETLLYFDIENASFVVKIDPRITARPGDTIGLATDLEKIYIFDEDTELVVLN